MSKRWLIHGVWLAVAIACGVAGSCTGGERGETGTGSSVTQLPEPRDVIDDRTADAGVYRADVKSGSKSTPGEEAAAALARIGKPAIDPLITALRASTSAVARRNAAWALGQLDTNHGSTSAAAPPPSTTRQD